MLLSRAQECSRGSASLDQILSLRRPDFMYGPLRSTRTDLVAVTIQRGRDFGLRSYADVRKALGLPPIGTFGDLNPELSSSNPKVKTPQVHAGVEEDA